MTPQELARYSQQIRLSDFGLESQEKLKNAKILCVGAGGLACPALLYLASAGIGTLGLIDSDRVELSNLQRQILFTESDVDKPKVTSAAKRLKVLNSNVLIQEYPFFLNEANALSIIKEFDLILDCSDNFPTRYLINDACFTLNKPFISAAVMGFEGQLTTFIPGKTPCYRCIYKEPPPTGLAPSCAENGILGVLPGLFGVLQATEAIKLITGIGTPLLGRLLSYNALNLTFNEFEAIQHNECVLCKQHTPFDKLTRPQQSCSNDTKTHEIEPRQFDKQKEHFFLLDVRDPYESEICTIGGTLIPLSTLESNLHKVPQNLPILVYCKKGGRSQKAAALLIEHGFKQVHVLKGGVLAWIDTVAPHLQRY